MLLKADVEIRHTVDQLLNEGFQGFRERTKKPNMMAHIVKETMSRKEKGKEKKKTHFVNLIRKPHGCGL